MQKCELKTNLLGIMYKGGLKSSHVISAIDTFFEQWDPSIATLMEDVCGPKEKTNSFGHISGEYLG